MRKFRIAAAVVTATALLVLPSTGHAGKGGGGLMEAVPNSGFPGDSFVVHNLDGSECFANEVQVTIDGPAPFGDEAATASFFKGDWEVDFTVPAGSTPGPYVVNAVCQSSTQTDNVSGPTVQSIFFPYVPVTYTVLGQESPEPSPSPDPSPSPSESPDVGAGYEEAPAAQPEVEAAAFTG
jgi:hypothetical protein